MFSSLHGLYPLDANGTAPAMATRNAYSVLLLRLTFLNSHLVHGHVGTSLAFEVIR